MDRELVRVYVRHVGHQARIGVRALSRMEKEEQRSRDGFWGEVQTLAVASGNVAKALWGAGGRRAEERAPVRLALQVSDDSALQTFSDFRNDIEHLDDRIRQWWDKEPHRPFMDQRYWHPSMSKKLAPSDWLPDSEGPSPPAGEDDTYFRVYVRGIVFFWGVEYPLLPIAHELDRLRVRVAELEREWQGHR